MEPTSPRIDTQLVEEDGDFGFAACPSPVYFAHRTGFFPSVPSAAAWTEVPPPPQLVRQDAGIFTPRPQPEETPVVHLPPLELQSSEPAAATGSEPPVSPLRISIAKKKRDQHPKAVVKRAKRVRLTPAHLSEMRTRFLEVMDVLDPQCPTCHQRLSDSAQN